MKYDSRFFPSPGILPFVSIRQKIAIALLLLVVIAGLYVWLVYSPEHWLERVNFGKVLLDDRPVQADIYMGHPTDNQGEVVALVHTTGEGDYFLDFNNELFREGTNHEFLRLNQGIWTYKPMREGQFRAALPLQNLNEFRLALPDGHVLTVKF